MVVLSGGAIAGDGWMTDIDAALAKGKAEKKAVMVEFTGSDWCPPCIMMHKKVFSKKSFTDAASKKFILVVIDIPNKDPKLKKKNSKVLKKYKVSGVPSVLLFGDDGKEFSRFSASQFPSVDAFLSHIHGELEKREMD
ncbi:MAG: thioredoxin family protein [Verrucomicrobiae bacterium]|nr:thioredoxin family protein [Verrucomicrobiae bacterium]